MKIKLLTAVCVIALIMSGTTPALAQDEDVAMLADITVVRPICLVGTIIGSAFFVVSLPIAAASKSVKRSKQMLVEKPAKATFTRRLGDMDALMDY